MKPFIISFAFVLTLFNLQAQDDYSLPPYEISGYIKDVQTVFIPDANSEYWLSDNSFHNRLKFEYFATDWLTLDVQMRNRFIYGDFVKLFPNYEDIAMPQNKFIDLDFVWADDSSYVGLSELDRLYAQFVKGNWEITIGRQRINWGMNLVWNPNDIFNTFSYFDFEYEERPGTDAMRVKYYTSMTGSAELVYEAGDSIEEMAMAGLYKFNKWNYDIQLLGGFMGEDYVLGAGYSGSIGGAGFRGEATFFQPMENIDDTTNTLVASISGDYTFPNTLYLHGGILFNSNGKTGKPGQIDMFDTQKLSPKMLSRGKVNLFGQISGNLGPLITANISTIFNPDDLSAFVSPSLTVSLSDNFACSVFGQFFMGDEGSEYGKIGEIAYLRFKYSF